MKDSVRLKTRTRATLTCALTGMVLLITFPVEAAEAARKAMEVWASAFAPALFPFFVLIPALSTPEATLLYERLLGRAMEKLFGCPGRVAGAAMLAWMAGSPAGAIALSRVKRGMTRGQLSRAAVLCSALSPGFLVSAVGAGMLGSAEAGYVLLRSQLLALLAGGLMLRRAWTGDGAPCDAEDASGRKRANPVRGAVLDVLTVCGWMVCFGVAARLLTLALPGAGIALLPLMEVTGGCAVLASSIAPVPARLIVIAFACGLGGLSVLMQNADRLREVPRIRLVWGKLLHAALTATFTAAQLKLPRAPAFWPLSTFETALLLGSTLCIVVAVLHFALKRRASQQRTARREPGSPPSLNGHMTR